MITDGDIGSQIRWCYIGRFVLILSGGRFVLEIVLTIEEKHREQDFFILLSRTTHERGGRMHITIRDKYERNTKVEF
jgi:hypothetical protein